jgi:hypothetical protein
MRVLLLLSLILTFNIHPALAQQGDDLEQQFDKTAKGFSQDGTKLQGLKEGEFSNDPEKPKAEGLKESFVTNMMTGVMKQAIDQFLKENPFSKMERQEVKSMIELKTNGLPVATLFKNHPKILDIFVDWIRDDKALPKIIGIVNKPDEVKVYGFIVMGIFILSFILNLANSKGGLGKRILKKLMIFVGAFAINIGTFFFLFKEEMKPTLDIIFRYYHL